MEMDAKVLIF